MKVVLYTKDPRGIILSRFFKSLRVRKEFIIKEANTLCSMMKSDYEEFLSLSQKHPSNFMHLRYEDFVSNYTSSINRLYSFTGATLPDNLLPFYHDALGGARREGGKSSVFRKNATATALKWQTELSKKQSDTIRVICEEIIRLLKYPIV